MASGPRGFTVGLLDIYVRVLIGRSSAARGSDLPGFIETVIPRRRRVVIRLDSSSHPEC